MDRTEVGGRQSVKEQGEWMGMDWCVCACTRTYVHVYVLVCVYEIYKNKLLQSSWISCENIDTKPI